MQGIVKPAFQSVLDLGLRDVGVRNQPRRIAARFGRFAPLVVALALIGAVAGCVLLKGLGAGRGSLPVFGALWTASVILLALKFVSGAPVAVLRAGAEGRNQLLWLAHAPAVLLCLLAVIVGSPPLIAIAALHALVTVVMYRPGRRIPALVQRVAEHLQPGESVLGDALARAGGERGAGALRVVAATSRRLLIGARDEVVEVPYARIGGFAIEWKVVGRVGTLTLRADGVPALGSMNPPNLLSIARALRANGVAPEDPGLLAEAERRWQEALQRGRPRAGRTSLVPIGLVVLTVLGVAVGAAYAAGLRDHEELPADGRSDLHGGAASLTYTPAAGLRELITDEHFDAGPHDGARWELRTQRSAGSDALTLSHYIFDDPPLDSPAAVRAFVAGKDAEHAELAGRPVGHTTRVVAGRTGYVWEHRTRNDLRYFTAWFPQPVHTVRLECIARGGQPRLQRLCAEALRTLRFGP
jgi:hypothetical protein